MTHTVVVAIDGDGMRESVRFICAGTAESDCHNYPDAEEWHDGDGQERLPHEECWLQSWFDNSSYWYTGADSLEEEGELGVPHFARSGEIEFEFEPWVGPTWWWKGAKP